jgi:putative peptidoglycan lipid II flippase
VFQLPYAIVGISVISALLPRMSGHATDRRYSLVRDDFSTGVRLASVIVVPAAVFLGVLGAPLCELLFAHGSLTVSQARYVGELFGMLSLGLVPFMVTQLQLRVFYSFRDNRTPGIIGFVMLLVGVIGDFAALNVLPPSQVVVGLGAVYGLVTVVGAVIAWPLLLRHVGASSSVAGAPCCCTRSVRACSASTNSGYCALRRAASGGARAAPVPN